MKIFSFYGEVPGISNFDSLKLLIHWREAWSAMGAEPFVMNMYQSEKHPLFEELETAVAKLPTVNSVLYEKFCYCRWLALAQMGGGFMADYDVFACHSNATSLLLESLEKCPDKLHIFQNRNVCPCLVYASKEIAERVCREFATLKWGKRDHNGKEHWSDQYALEDLVTDGADWIETHNLVRLYGDEDWKAMPYVHLANAALKPREMSPRWKFVETILKEATHKSE